jgi:replicative DNA helicase
MINIPYNLDAEVSLLGSMLLDNNVIGESQGIISAEDFYDTRHSLLFKAMVYMYSNEEAIDTVTLVSRLGKRLQDTGGVTYITQLFNSAIPGNSKHYIKIIKEVSNKRKIIKLAQEMTSKALDTEATSDSILSAAEDSIFKMAGITKNGLMASTDVVKSTLQEIDIAYKNGGKITGIETGFSDIDRMMNGLNRGDMVVIAARPSMGKTALAVNIGMNTSKNCSTAIFELEMSATQLCKRMLSCESEITHNNLKRGKLQDKDYDNLIKAGATLAQRKLYIDETPGQTILEIKAKCKKHKLQHGLDVVIIDYMGLMESIKSVESRTQEISVISRSIKNMAKELDVAVISLAQLNRAPEMRSDHRPILSDLRESGSIEQDADVVIMLYRDDYYNPETERKGITEAIFSKNRNGEVGTVELVWMPEFQRFYGVFKGDANCPF